MSYFVPEVEWRKLHGAKRNAVEIRQRATYIIAGLKALFSDHDAEGIGLLVEVDDASGLGTISTPFCAGRFMLEWEVEDELVGLLVAERQYRTRKDELMWEPRFSVLIPASGVVRIGEGEQTARIHLDHGLWSHNSDGFFVLGMSILHSFTGASSQIR